MENIQSGNTTQRSNLIMKILTVGSVGVGKTCLINRYYTGEFSEEYLITIGAQFYSKEIHVRDTKVKVQIWDTAGQEQYHSITTSYFRNTAAALLVFNLGSKQSFEDLNTWLKELYNNAHEHIHIMLIGNKSDLGDARQITREEAAEFAKKNNLSYYEVSAKSGDGVKEIFETVAEKVYDLVEDGTLVPDTDYTYGVKMRITNTSSKHDSKADGGGLLNIGSRKSGNCC